MTPPEGLQGELMMIILVFGVMALLDHVGGEGEAVGLVGFDEDALAAGVVDDVLVGDPVGDGDDDFVAGVDEQPA